MVKELKISVEGGFFRDFLLNTTTMEANKNTLEWNVYIHT